MKRNEKILAAALGLMLVGYFAWPTFRSVFIDPVTELEGQADRLATKIADQEQQEFDLLLAGRRLDEARKRGLPGSDLDAQRLYQQWLTDLAQATGLSVQVTPGRRYPVGDVYNGVQVTLEGTATFDELQTFLNRLRRVDLLHRVQRLDVDSPSVEGDPELKLSLTAEGLNFRGAPSRSRLFPQTELAEPLPADAKELTVPRKELAASSGDFLRIGDEFVAVAAVEGDRLRLDRGADGTRAAEHPAGATVELLPVRKPDKDEPPVVLADVDSPFVKPRRYEPHFDGFADAKLVRGESTKMTVRVADYDASAGVPRMELVSGPPGLKFDATSGEMVWEPSADVPSGEHQVTLAATVPNPQKRIEQTATITVVDPNTPPTLDAVAPTEIFLGETLRVPLKATDAESGSLDYKVEQGPEGATIDPATGELRWAVPESFAPGEVTVTVAASDKGEPPLSAKQTFTVKVRENLKPFVHLSGTWVEATAGGDAAGEGLQKQAFLYDRSSNEWTRLREGRTFEAAGLTGTVKEIGSDFITYVRDGEIWRLRVGRHLGQAEKIGGEPVAVARPNEAPQPVEAARPGAASPRPAPAPSAAAEDRTPAS